jgi:CO/xanthine dehydrogenase Mo-binding subunit
MDKYYALIKQAITDYDHDACARQAMEYKQAHYRWTNPQAGAFRGYGVFQASFVMGILMDEMAEAVGMDPFEFWRKNSIREGESHPIFAEVGEVGKGVAMVIASCALPECLEKAAAAFGWKERQSVNSELEYKPELGLVRYLGETAEEKRNSKLR